MRPNSTPSIRVGQSWLRHPLTWLVVAAFVLRVATVMFGMSLFNGETHIHSDEPKVVDTVVGFPEDYASSTQWVYANVHQRLVGIPVEVLDWLGAGERGLRRAALLAMRTLSAALGALSIVLTFRLGLILYDRRTAWIASGLLSVWMLHVMLSGFATLDVIMGFWLALSSILAYRALLCLRPIDFVWLGLAMGMLMSTKVNAGIFAVVPVSLAVACCLDRSAATLRRVLVGAVITATLAVLVLFISTPEIFLNTEGFLGNMKAQKQFYVERLSPSVGAILNATGTSLWGWLHVPLAVLIVLGLLRTWPKEADARTRRLKQALVIALALLAISGPFFFKGHLHPRFWVWLTPIVALVAARPIAWATQSGRAKGWRVAGVVALIVVTGFEASRVVAAHARRVSDSRMRASLDSQLLMPPGASVYPLKLQPFSAWPKTNFLWPNLDNARNPIVDIDQQPDFVVLDSLTLSRLQKVLPKAAAEPGYVLPAEDRWPFKAFEPPDPADLRFVESLGTLESAYREVGRWEPITAWGKYEWSDPTIVLYQRKAFTTPASQ